MCNEGQCSSLPTDIAAVAPLIIGLCTAQVKMGFDYRLSLLRNLTYSSFICFPSAFSYLSLTLRFLLHCRSSWHVSFQSTFFDRCIYLVTTFFFDSFIDSYSYMLFCDMKQLKNFFLPELKIS